MTDLLYDDRTVEQADESVALPLAAITVLTNRPLRTGWADRDPRPMLPLARGMKLYIEGIAPALAAQYGDVVATPAEADAAILRLQAPSASLDFPTDVIDHVEAVAAAVPTVVDVVADRPALVEPLVESAVAVTLSQGASTAVLLDVLTGGAEPQGRLPFDLPRSATPEEASGPLFELGHGLAL